MPICTLKSYWGLWILLLMKSTDLILCKNALNLKLMWYFSRARQIKWLSSKVAVFLVRYFLFVHPWTVFPSWAAAQRQHKAMLKHRLMSTETLRLHFSTEGLWILSLIPYIEIASRGLLSVWTWGTITASYNSFHIYIYMGTSALF